MSRNIGQTTCKFCPGDLALLEPERPITAKDCGEGMLREFSGMLVANAECPLCLAQYLAWMRAPAGQSYSYGRDHEQGTPYDISFRHSFNDEPSDRDLPRYVIETQYVRARPYGIGETYSAYLRLGPVK